MIHVDLADEPASFHDAVRVPGERSVAEMVGKTSIHPRTGGRAFKQRSVKRLDSNGTSISVLVTCEGDLPAREFEPYWIEALDDLMEAYGRICAYSCFRINPVTGARSVDHMAPKSKAWDRVYEWDNYRLCASSLNARKNDFEDVLDPFGVEDGWFIMEMVGFQVLPNPEHPGMTGALRAQIVATAKRLGLNGPKVRDLRESHIRDYTEGHVSLAYLIRESPFVAKELARQGRLHACDVGENPAAS